MDIEAIKSAIINLVDEALESYEYDESMDGCDFYLGASGPILIGEPPESCVSRVVDKLSEGLQDLQKQQDVIIGDLSVNIDSEAAELSIEVPVICVKFH